MRGKLTFRKIIQRMPSGKFRWVINGDFDVAMASGIAINKRAARQEAITVERRLMCEHEQSKRVLRAMPADSGYTFRARERAHCRELCNRKSQ